MKIFDFNEKYFLRNIMGAYMVNIGKKDEKLVVVNADLSGTCRNKSFAEIFPERAFNVGIAEQNMVSFAAGLAHEGFKPYAFSMAPFICMRACEQCRTDVAYANLNVRLLGTYAGVSGGISGATHWSVEDCAIMGTMANMTVLEPCDPIQAEKMLEATLNYNGPVYIRSTVEPVISVYDDNYNYEIGKASIVKTGTDGAYICSGITVKYALEAALHIKKEMGKDIRVIDMHTIKPIDRKAVIEAANTGNLVIAQDHNKIGGLGYYVANILAEEAITTRFVNLGVDDKFETMAHAPYLYKKFGYDTEGLEKAMIELLNKK